MVNIFKDPTPTPAPAGEPTKHFILTGSDINLPICGLTNADAVIIMAPLQVTCVKCLQMIDDLARVNNFTQATEIISNAVDPTTISQEWLAQNSIEDIPSNTIGNQEDTFYTNMINFSFVTESGDPEEEYLTKISNIKNNL